MSTSDGRTTLQVNQHFNLTPLCDDVFCLASFRRHFNIIMRLIGHTSITITFYETKQMTDAQAYSSL
ncbi:hypothetical protein ASD02_23220 [Ensifer sp. Root1252]|nr:hypothetical protein ASD02_23220 [Ensifer sp. Root1252]KRC77952.1 hypothetical protein ASE32_27830 [Ensifer sp. Root231]KRD00372.1 hypothetical protein ASE47_23790 [Ensifer sp. Root258]